MTVEGGRLRFAAAHMATLGDELEPLHGHNYEVRCRVEGDLTDDRWVIDFSVLKRLAHEACERLDHRFLLQERSTRLQVAQEGAEWVVAYGERRYRFPASDVCVLPIENTTAELIAEWIWDEVAAGLALGAHSNVVRLSVDVEEMPGQSGGYAAALPRATRA
ncbi:MAG: 6-pyruvoyl tetrahydropterin synthase family protein [Dehalococcoidia bacterium]